MNKSIELTTTQIKARVQGAKMFILPIVLVDDELEYTITDIKKGVLYATCEHKKRIKNIEQPISDFIKQESPVQKGDKDIFIKEEFLEKTQLLNDDKSILRDFEEEHYRYDIAYKSDYPINISKKFIWEDSPEMTIEQSRYTMSEILDVRVVRVQDTELDDLIKIYPYEKCDEDGLALYEYVEDICYDLSINHEDNDYIFLIEEK